jgi:hypothetical protein
MSLINDALKRARESQRNNPPSGAPPLPPVESPARGGTGWILAMAAVLFLAAVGFFLGPALFGHKVPPTVTAKTPGMIAPPPAESAPSPAPASLAVTVTDASPAPAVNTNPPPTAVPVEQLPKLQGIIFNAARPVAIVNGKAVNVGDRVGDFQVKQILRNSVIFQRPDGSQKTLGIGE